MVPTVKIPATYSNVFGLNWNSIVFDLKTFLKIRAVPPPVTRRASPRDDEDDEIGLVRALSKQIYPSGVTCFKVTSSLDSCHVSVTANISMPYSAIALVSWADLDRIDWALMWPSTISLSLSFWRSFMSTSGGGWSGLRFVNNGWVERE